MLLNLDEQQLRLSLRMWQEEMNLARPTLAGASKKARAEWLARLEHTLTGCLTVLHASTPVHSDGGGFGALMEELRERREWAQEGRRALEMLAQVQR